MLKDRATILLVEDDTAIAGFLDALLSPTYTVIHDTTGAQALASLAATRVDLILLDVGLPDVDGFDLCRRLKEAPEYLSIPVIFLTARAAPADETRAFDIGGVDFIAKPVVPAVLMARVRTHVELKKNRDALEQLVFVDGLTGLPNRRAFDQALVREWRRELRTHEPLCVAMIDVDHFKQFNDTYGHGAGDNCLRAVAQALRSTLQRPADMVARYGGEEFVALLPGTTAEGGTAVVRSMVAAVAALSIPHAKSSAATHVTISAGVCAAVPTAEADAARVVKGADEQLYAAKRGGRNRVSVATSPSLPD
ncbi:MAG: diguanylate cyclase [Rhodospirillaceae bacterium]|nr:diguanylate cyclase [Rhodospirillaceae bacterium]